MKSALLSVYRVAFNFRFTMWGDQFPNANRSICIDETFMYYLTLCRIRNVNCPVFIIHGTKDEIVPFWNGEDLFLLTPVHWRACPFWVENAGHNNVETMFRFHIKWIEDDLKYCKFREEGLFFSRFEEFLQDHVDAYRSRGGRIGDLIVVDTNFSTNRRKLIEDNISTNQKIEWNGTDSFDGNSHSSNRSNTSYGSDSTISSAEMFPNVVDDVDSSAHFPSTSAAPILPDSVTMHDIRISESNDIDREELAHEFEKKDSSPHNTI